MVKEGTFPGFVAVTGTLQTYEYTADVAAVALTVASCPWQAVGLLTVTIGLEFKVIVPEALVLTHPVMVLVMITL